MRERPMKEIERIPFSTFLTRPYNLLTVFAHTGAYREHLKKTLGFQFRFLGYLSYRRVVNVLRTGEELRAFDRRIERTMTERPSVFSRMLRSGRAFNTRMADWQERQGSLQRLLPSLSKHQLGALFRKVFDIYSEQFVTTTVIPFRAGMILERLLRLSRDARMRRWFREVKRLRLVTEYIPFESHVLVAVLGEVARRAKFENPNRLFDLSPQEINGLIDGSLRLNEKRVRKQREYYSLFFIDGSEVFYSGRRVYDRFRKKFGLHFDQHGHRTLAGTSAFPGKVRGRVKVIFHNEDMKKFKRGDILVTINSSPRFMPAIRLCRAIIADEGGVTSHAAIVAREFKIPSVIGTKVATQMLKDGDRVEVDATKGIVRKL